MNVKKKKMAYKVSNNSLVINVMPITDSLPFEGTRTFCLLAAKRHRGLLMLFWCKSNTLQLEIK